MTPAEAIAVVREALSGDGPTARYYKQQIGWEEFADGQEKARAALALIEQRMEEVDGLSKAAVREARRCNDFRQRWEKAEGDWALQHDRAEAAEREREELREQALKFGREAGGYLYDVLNLQSRITQLEEALREIEHIAGAGGSGEIPAMPIATRARTALSGKEEG